MMDVDVKAAICAVNADIAAFIAPRLPVKPSLDGVAIEDIDTFLGPWRAAWRKAWLAAMTAPKIDEIRRAHGFVPCGDAPGWYYDA